MVTDKNITFEKQSPPLLPYSHREGPNIFLKGKSQSLPVMELVSYLGLGLSRIGRQNCKILGKPLFKQLQNKVVRYIPTW